MNKKEVTQLIEKGFLISPDILDTLTKNEDDFIYFIESKIKSKEKPLIINQDILSSIKKPSSNFDINWLEFESSKALLEKGKNGKVYKTFLDILNFVPGKEVPKFEEDKTELTELEKPVVDMDSNVLVLKSFKENSKKRQINQFVSYFKIRYKLIRDILANRQELKNLISIDKILNKAPSEQVSIIGLVYDKRITKNGNLILTLEDITGKISVLVTKGKRELLESAKDIVHDEIIGITGVLGDRIIFVNNVVWPDIPARPIKKSEDEVYTAFISDIHVGSKLFLYKEFLKFIDWINGEVGNEEQRSIAKKIKYLFIVGDAVDGCGIYPNQDKELIIKNVYRQYAMFAKLLKKIRSDLNIIICPGNHDAIRLSVPQPAIDKEAANELWEMPNVTIVSNPALVNIHSFENFEGFDVLMYHGFSFDYYLRSVEGLRLKDTKNNPSILSTFLLKRRHLAPTHTSTLYIPEEKEDPLFIDKIPDIFVNGHVHKCDTTNYNGVTTISNSCWQEMNEWQEKCGHSPDRCKVPVINLKTREVKIYRFGK